MFTGSDLGAGSSTPTRAVADGSDKNTRCGDVDEVSAAAPARAATLAHEVNAVAPRYVDGCHI